MMAIYALEEQYKFFNYLCSNTWPDNMGTFRHNLLRSTSVDTEIASNKGNVNTILFMILHSLRRLNLNLVTSLNPVRKERVQTDTVHNHSDSDDNSTMMSLRSTQFLHPILLRMTTLSHEVNLLMNNWNLNCTKTMWKGFVLVDLNA